MSEFDEYFQSVAHGQDTADLLANLELIVDDHVARYRKGEALGMTSEEMGDFRVLSALPMSVGYGPCFKVDRSTEELLTPYGLKQQSFLNHIGEKQFLISAQDYLPFLTTVNLMAHQELLRSIAINESSIFFNARSMRRILCSLIY